MKEKLKLNVGETIKITSHRSKGSMAETDIDEYHVINQQGETVGTVKHTDHTAIRGFKRTQTLTQRNNSGHIVVEVTW